MGVALLFVVGSATATPGALAFGTPLPTPTCKVPDMKGEKLPAAESLLRRARCAVGEVTKAYSSKVKTGRVVSQKPVSGSRRPFGSRVKLVVSKGPRSTKR